MDEVTLLSREQIFGDNKLNIFNKITPQTMITDFSILLGSGVCLSYFGGNKKNQYGNYFTKTNYGYSNIYYISYFADLFKSNFSDYNIGIRPIISYSKIKNNILNEIINEDGITEVEYGEYPQYAVNKELQIKLEELYQNGKLTETNKIYTTDSRKYDEYDKDFLPQDYIEYEFDDKKYVRVKANTYHIDFHPFILSNDEEYVNGNYVWVEVSKVKWLVDEENDIALSKYVLVSGIQFDNREEYTGDFENTNIYKFLNTYFIKDIQVYIDISKISGTYEQAMALIEEAKRRHNEILNKSIIGKTLIKKL